jgi:Protein of unknown function (DUF4019)
LLTSAETIKPTSRGWLWYRKNCKWLLGIVLAGLILSRLHVHFGYVDGDKKQTVESIEQFHERMNVEQYDQIYADANPAFRNSLTREEWLQHMHEVREQCGRFKSTRISKLNVLMGNPVQIRAAYNSTFEKGPATELFGFAREGDKVQLLIYGISADGVRFGSAGYKPKMPVSP